MENGPVEIVDFPIKNCAMLVYQRVTFLYDNQLIHLNNPLKQRKPNICIQLHLSGISSFGVRTWHIMCPDAKQLVANVANVADPEDLGPLVLSRELLLVGRKFFRPTWWTQNFTHEIIHLHPAFQNKTSWSLIVKDTQFP